MKSPANTLKLSVFCPACPTATLRVAGIEPPTEHASITRIHTACENCGLGWTYTATCAPMRDHTADRYGVKRKHPTFSLPVVV